MDDEGSAPQGQIQTTSLLADQELSAILAIEPGRGAAAAGPGFAGGGVTILGGHFAAGLRAGRSTCSPGGTAKNIRRGKTEFVDQGHDFSNSVFAGITTGFFNLKVEVLTLRQKVLQGAHVSIQIKTRL